MKGEIVRSMEWANLEVSSSFKLLLMGGIGMIKIEIEILSCNYMLLVIQMMMK